MSEWVLLESGNAGSNIQKSRWFKGRPSSNVLVTVTILSILVVLTGAYLYVQDQQNRSLTIFTCQAYAGGGSFTVAVRISSMQGMMENETTDVACKVLRKTFEINPQRQYDIDTVKMECERGENGTWTVDINYIYEVLSIVPGTGQYSIGRYRGVLNMVINPFERTVFYAPGSYGA